MCDSEVLGHSGHGAMYHPAILLRITDKLVRFCILVLVQEIKRNIIFRRMQLTEPSRQEVPSLRLQAHLLSVI
jgi:hypothetical protein